MDHKIIGEGATSNTIGYRIPTQAQSSIHALRFVDVVPAVKSTVILPTEFTKITGSDKLYQCSNQYNIKNRVNCWELHIKRTISSQAL
nr:MAG TPA: Proline utilization A N-terminal domain [Caudoviricetes sp.]